MLRTDALRAILLDHLTDDPDAVGRTAACSAAHAMVWHRGEVVFDEAHGLAQLTPQRRALPPSPVFDLASVTKPIVAIAAWQAIDRGLLAWDTPVADLLPEWDEAPGAPDGARLLHLLNHSSGLPAWHKYYEEHPLDLEGDALAAQRQHILGRVLRTAREAAPGARHLYSDLGYMALCALLERLHDAPLSTIVERDVLRPLGLQARFVDRLRGDTPIPRAISTEHDPIRGRVITGEVHDENTATLGGASGHAGIFSTARDLLTLGAHLAQLDVGLPTEHAPLVSRPTLRFAWSEAARGATGHHLGGWDTPSGQTSSAGPHAAPDATVGHLGFTGTSIWIARDLQAVVVLLTNRVHPHRTPSRIHPLRVAFHAEAFGSIRGAV